MRALAIRPDERFPTAAHFAEAIEQAMHDAGIRLASTRQVAAFVDEFKVEITTGSLPPTPPLEENTSTGLESVPSGLIDIASMPSFPSMPTPSSPSATGGSSLTGVGAVHSRVFTPARTGSRRALYLGGGVVAAIAIGIIAVSAVGKDEVPPPAESNVSQPAETAAQNAHQPPAASATPAESPAPATTPAPSVSVTPSAEPEKIPVPRGTPVPAHPKTKGGKGPNGNPLDYDPNTL